MITYFGVDIGGTKIKLGAFDDKGAIVDKWSIDTDISDAGSHIIPDVAQAVKGYLAQHPEAELAGIGLGIPGPVDGNGYVYRCVNLNWNDFNPVTELSKFFPDIKAAAGNDANVAALGEYHMGGGAGSSSMMMVTLGTGVGGGVIIDGKIIGGAHGIAGEIGHISTNPLETEDCSCGNRGCINQISSATGIVRHAKKMLESGTESAMKNFENLSAKDVCDCAKAGDELAVKCISECMIPLAKGLVYFSHAFDPEVYVIGGGVSHAGEFLVEATRKEMVKDFYISGAPDIKLASLGNDAGIIGACMLVAK